MSTKTATVTVQGVDIAIEFDHQPKEAETLTYPGCPESVEITEVQIKGFYLATEWLSNYFIELIEAEALKECG